MPTTRGEGGGSCALGHVVGAGKDVAHGLGDIGVPTHFVRRLNMREQLIREVEIIPLEIVVRNVAAGSLSTRLGIPEGTVKSRMHNAVRALRDELADLVEDDAS